MVAVAAALAAAISAGAAIGLAGPTSGAVGAHPVPVAARLAGGSPEVPAGWSAAAYQLRIGGLVRSYLTVEPRSLTGRVPVVVLLPGRGMTPAGVLRISRLAGRIGPAVLVVPAGWERGWNAGDCCGAAFTHRVNDVGFIRSALRAVLASTPGAQPARVYAVGFSNGGRMAYQLACELPHTFAGIMAVEAVPVAGCPAMAPVNITMVAQQADPLLTVAAGAPPKSVGGHVEPTVSATVARMGRLDGCRGRPLVTAEGTSVERTWSCARGTRLRYVWYPGGSHQWRSPTAATPGATDYVMQLMGRSSGAPANPGSRGRRPSPSPSRSRR